MVEENKKFTCDFCDDIIHSNNPNIKCPKGWQKVWLAFGYPEKAYSISYDICKKCSDTNAKNIFKKLWSRWTKMEIKL